MSAARRWDLLAIGEPMVELSMAGERDGRALYLAGHGGDTSNTAVAAARFGARVAYCTRVGEDAFGDRLLEAWRAAGVDTSLVVRDAGAPTGIFFSHPRTEGRAYSYYRRGSAASRLSVADLPAAALAASRLLHVSGVSQAISTSACDAVFAAIEAARAAGARVSYDPNLRPALWPGARARAVIHEAMRQSDIVLPSLEDARALTGLEDRDALVDAYLALGAGVVALKLGAGGVLVASAAERHHLPAPAVSAVDTSGAGDIFDGVFLACLLGGAPLAGAACQANAAAALSTERYGGCESIPSRAAVEALLAAPPGRPAR